MKTFPIIEKLGGRKAVAEIVSGGHCRPVSADAVRMWSARGRIPGYAIRLMMEHAERRKIAIAASDLQPSKKEMT